MFDSTGPRFPKLLPNTSVTLKNNKIVSQGLELGYRNVCKPFEKNVSA
jgi:hypothetical protein